MFASLPEKVVLPEPCRPEIKITAGSSENFNGGDLVLDAGPSYRGGTDKDGYVRIASNTGFEDFYQEYKITVCRPNSPGGISTGSVGDT